MKYLGLLCVLISFASFSACRFQAPALNESKYLIEQKTFAGNVPAWFPNSVLQGEGVKRTSGLVPSSFAPPLNIGSNRESLNDSQNDRESFSTVAEEIDDSPDNALARISERCPGSEPLINDAITTIDVRTRKNKYLAFLRRCPNTPDVWVWISQDYLALNDLRHSAKAIKRALFLDPNNQDALSVKQQIIAEKRRREGR